MLHQMFRASRSLTLARHMSRSRWLLQSKGKLKNPYLEKIKQMFSSNDVSVKYRQQGVHEMVEKDLSAMTLFEISTLFKYCGPNKSGVSLAPHLARITKVLTQKKNGVHSDDVANLMYGLQKMSDKEQGMTDFLRLLREKVSECETPLDGREIGESLYGLKNMTSESKAVRELLGAFKRKINETTDILNAHEIAQCLHGLQCMSSDHGEVRGIINALAPNIEASKYTHEPVDIGKALYGLRGMNSDYAEVRKLLSSMHKHILKCNINFDGHSLGSALHGLQGMRSHHPEVRETLSLLADKFAASKKMLSSGDIGSALYGFQNMTSSGNAQVQKLLDVMTVKITSSSAVPRGREMAAAVFGLQKMSSSCPHIRGLLAALKDKLASCEELQNHDLSNILFGMRTMSTHHAEVREFLAVLKTKIVQEGFQPFSSQDIGNALSGLKEMGEQREVMDVLSALIPRVRACREPLSPIATGGLFGFKLMSSKQSEVREMLAVLKPLIAANHVPLAGKTIVYSMYGLANMDMRHPEVREMVDCLIGKIPSARYFGATEAKAILGSLRRLSKLYPDVDKYREVVNKTAFTNDFNEGASSTPARQEDALIPSPWVAIGPEVLQSGSPAVSEGEEESPPDPKLDKVMENLTSMALGDGGNTDLASMLKQATGGEGLATDLTADAALLVASQRGYVKVLQLLLRDEGGLDVNLVSGDEGVTALMCASQEGHLEVVDMLLKKGARVDQARDDGATALMLASHLGHTDVVTALVVNDAVMDRATEEGVTALMLAAQQGHGATVRVLLRRGASLDLGASDGSTALILASQEGRVDVVQSLLDAGADVNHVRKDGGTALLLACQQGQDEVIGMLLRAGAHVDYATSTSGVTPLMLASQQGHKSAVEMLLAHKADVTSVGVDGITALELAVDEGHVDIEKLLLRAGAKELSAAAAGTFSLGAGDEDDLGDDVDVEQALRDGVFSFEDVIKGADVDDDDDDEEELVVGQGEGGDDDYEAEGDEEVEEGGFDVVEMNEEIEAQLAQLRDKAQKASNQARPDDKGPKGGGEGGRRMRRAAPRRRRSPAKGAVRGASETKEISAVDFVEKSDSSSLLLNRSGDRGEAKGAGVPGVGAEAKGAGVPGVGAEARLAPARKSASPSPSAAKLKTTPAAIPAVEASRVAVRGAGDLATHKGVDGGASAVVDKKPKKVKSYTLSDKEDDPAKALAYFKKHRRRMEQGAKTATAEPEAAV